MPPESLDQKFARFVRQQRGMQTFAQFSRKLQVSESTLHRIENGHGSSTLRLVQQILRALHCDYEDAFGGGAMLKAAETPEKSDGQIERKGTPYEKKRRGRSV